MTFNEPPHVDNTPIKLSNSDGSSALELNLTTPANSPGPQNLDAMVVLTAKSAGYTGHSDAWVYAAALSRFCQDLMALEKSLRGEARLESLSPGELSLRIFAANSRGLLAATGAISFRTIGESQSFNHALEFGFEFEPMQLTNAIRLPWVALHRA